MFALKAEEVKRPYGDGKHQALHHVRIELSLIILLQWWNFRNVPPTQDRMQPSCARTRKLLHALYHKFRFFCIYGEKNPLFAVCHHVKLLMVHVKGTILPEQPNSAILCETPCENFHTV